MFAIILRKITPGLTLKNSIFNTVRRVVYADQVPKGRLTGNWIQTADRIAGYAHRTQKAF